MVNLHTYVFRMQFFDCLPFYLFQKLLERDQKLNEVEIASKQMADQSEEFSTLTHKLMIRQKEKAEWSWPFTSKKQ